jgi:TetR/AcrR family transcriptional repressor of nem operon
MPKVVLFDETAVLQNAMDLFWEKGYNGTSMDELTKATGLSRSSIYNSFGDKHQLFMRSLAFYTQQQTDWILQTAGKTSSPMKRIRQVFRAAIDAILQDKRRRGCMAVNATAEMANLDDTISQFLEKNMEGMEALFLQWIKEGQAAGEITKAFSATAIARHLFNTYSGLRISGKTKPERKMLEDMVDVALSALKA